jgi:hypothetical protein
LAGVILEKLLGNFMRLVSKVLKVSDPPKTRHYVGLLKEFTSEESQSQEMMKAPDVLLIEKRHEGFFLLRFTADGIPVGDTWHLNLEDAKHQAEFEFDSLISSWGEVPPNVTDVVSFALEKYL